MFFATCPKPVFPGAICSTLACVLLAGTASGVGAQEHEPRRYLPPARDPGAELETKISDSFVVATAGDLISPQPLERKDPGFETLINRVREADAAFANMESSLVNFPEFENGAVAGTLAPLSVGDAIKSMGFDLLNRANNHALDGGVVGMMTTDRALDELGIVHAGTGANLQEARNASFMETPKGRVALVGMYPVADTGNFGPTYARTLATDRIGSIGGAPGVNPLHLTTYQIVTEKQLESLQRIADEVYGERAGALVPSTANSPKRFRFFDQWYQAGEDAGAIHYEMDARDRKGIIDAIRSAKVYADFLIANVHSHHAPDYCGYCGFGTVRAIKEALAHEPPDFLIALAHEAIDNGADMFVVHGVHALAGVEIYKGKPIFYGLSNFIFQFGLQFGNTYDVMANYEGKSELDNPSSLESALAVSHFEGGRLKEVTLFPVDLGYGSRPLSQLGIPRVPGDEQALHILESLRNYSLPFGTNVIIRGGVGVIRVDASR